jgi:hypothetical protein
MRDIVPVSPRFRFFHIPINFGRFVPMNAHRIASVYVPIRRRHAFFFRGKQLFK